MARERSDVYSFDENLTSTRLTPLAEYRPFRAREAYLLSRRLGRPLTESEMRQFEYSESNSSNEGIDVSGETTGAYSNAGMNAQRGGAVLV